MLSFHTCIPKLLRWAIAIRFGLVRLAACAQECYSLGGPGGMLPRKNLKFRDYEIASETIFVPIRCFSQARRQFHMNATLPIGSYTNGVGFPILFAFFISQKPHPSQMKPNCKNGKSLEGRLAEQFCHTVRSHLTSFNMIPLCFGALRERPPSSGTNWQCQASHEWGEKWSS